ncbi:MAG: MurR/RpiR family transcriptional regulator [Fusobacteriaceae bacterium]
MSILIKLAEIKNTSSKMECKIIDFILGNVEKIKFLNTYEIAENCGVSQASIVRFAKKNGFVGFPEFKISLIEALGKISHEKKISIIDEEIKTTDSTKATAEKLLNKNIISLKNSAKIMDFNELEKAIKLLEKSRKILILGSGLSGIVAKYFQYKLLELGFLGIYDFDQHVQLSHLSALTEKDIVFVVSQSGKSLDTYNLLKKIKNKNIKIISLTNISKSPISELATINLWTAGESNSVSGTFTHRISQLSLLDLIYVKLVLKNSNLAKKYLENVVDLVEDTKMN